MVRVQSTTNIAYCSFDVYPAPKGAAVHIDAFARALAEAFGDVDLVTLAGPPAGPVASRPWLEPAASMALAPGLRHHALRVEGEDLVARVLAFRAALGAWWKGRRARIAHVRGLYEGYPIALRKQALCDGLVLEANGLASIELKYHYPDVADDRVLLAKLEAQEQTLGRAADLVITPSRVTARELEQRGIAASKIELIANGVDAELFTYREPPGWQGRPLRLLYVGTVAPWQGVHHALEALRLLVRDRPAELGIVGAMRHRERQWLRDRAAELDVTPFVRIHEPRPQPELVALYHQADIALVPLAPDDRNLVQGCSPLKLLEAMATGVPVVASALEVVTDLARPDCEVVTVRPGSGKAIKDGVLRLCADPALARRLSRSARERVEQEHSWRRACDRLVSCYADRLGLPHAQPGRPTGAESR
jgi:glycosyltransferase involved in cell wall biosynthesis